MNQQHHEDEDTYFRNLVYSATRIAGKPGELALEIDSEQHCHYGDTE